MPALAFPPQLFALFSSLIETRAGLYYGPAQRELLAEKLSVRAVDAGFESLLDYYYFLRYDEAGPGELDALVEALTVPETYLFRELDALRVLVSDVLAGIVRRQGRARIWSAACATGEEPLTLAMLLTQAGLRDEVALVASDISQHALRRARTGEFPRRSLRAPPPPDLARWVHREGDRVLVADEIRAQPSWRQINLIERDAVAAMGPFDAIVCRNVLIYFRESVAREVVDSLSQVLRPDGVLLVGVSESVLRFGTALRLEERRGVSLYRKQQT